MESDDNTGCFAIPAIIGGFAGLYFLTEYRFSIDFDIGPVTIFVGFVFGVATAFCTTFLILVALRLAMFLSKSVTFEKNLAAAAFFTLPVLQYLVNQSINSESVVGDLTAQTGSAVGGSAGGGYRYVYRSESIAWGAAWLMGLNLAQILNLLTCVYACFAVRDGKKI